MDRRRSSAAPRNSLYGNDIQNNSRLGYSNAGYYRNEEVSANNRRRSTQFGQNTFGGGGNYLNNYDQGDDFIGMGASMGHSEPPVGRLPPLEGEGETGGKKKGKKKKGLLKKKAKKTQFQDENDSDIAY